jgi:hypothetical protein
MITAPSPALNSMGFISGPHNATSHAELPFVESAIRLGLLLPVAPA